MTGNYSALTFGHEGAPRGYRTKNRSPRTSLEPVERIGASTENDELNYRICSEPKGEDMDLVNMIHMQSKSLEDLLSN